MAHPHIGAEPAVNLDELPAAPAAGAAAPGPPKSYRELLNEESNSLSRDRLATYLPTYLQGYRFDGGGIPAPATLRDQAVILSDRQPTTFLSLVQGPFGTSEVAIIHRLMRYMDMPGEEASGFHDRVLGLMGDIMPHQYPPTVDVPNTAYHLVGALVRVPTTEAMNALLPAWEDPNIPTCHWAPRRKGTPKRKWSDQDTYSLYPGTTLHLSSTAGE